MLLKGFLHWDSKRTTSPKQRLKSLCWKCKKISHWTTIEDLTRYSRIPTGCIGPYYLTIGGEMTESVEQGPFRVTFLPLRWGLQGCNLLGVRLAALSRAGCLLFGKVKYQLVAPIWVSLVKSPLQPWYPGKSRNSEIAWLGVDGTGERSTSCPDMGFLEVYLMFKGGLQGTWASSAITKAPSDFGLQKERSGKRTQGKGSNRLESRDIEDIAGLEGSNFWFGRAKSVSPKPRNVANNLIGCSSKTTTI